MASPDSIRTDLFVAAADPFFGEREAVKLAFADHGAVIAEQAVNHQSIVTAQPLTMSNLYVPNTLLSGLNARQTFSVRAADVTGSIRLGSSGVSEDDYYSFQGRANEFTEIEVISAVLARFPDRIDSIVTVTDVSGIPVAYYGQKARDDDTFQNQDARLIDLLLPHDGTYYIKVDTFPDLPNDLAKYPDNETGNYELLVYGFHSDMTTPPVSTFPEDTLFGGAGGNDTLVGGSGRRFSSTSRATRTGSIPMT